MKRLMFKKNKKEEKHGFISLDPFPGEGHMICSWQQRAGLNHTGVCVCVSVCRESGSMGGWLPLLGRKHWLLMILLAVDELDNTLSADPVGGREKRSW